MKLAVIGYQVGNDYYARHAPDMDAQFQPCEEIFDRTALDRLLDKAGGDKLVVLLTDSDGGAARLSAYGGWLRDNPQITLIPVGTGGPAAALANAAEEDIDYVNKCVSYGGEENYKKLFDWLRYRFSGGVRPGPPEPLPADGVFSLKTGAVYHTLKAFFEAENGAAYPLWVAMLVHRKFWSENNLAVERLLAAKLNEADIGVVPLFTEGGSLDREGARSMKELFRDCLYIGGRPAVSALISRLTTTLGGGKSSYDAMTDLYKDLGVPVFGPISAYMPIEDYENNPTPLSQELPWAYMTPELQGATEPVFLSLKDAKGNILPLEERIGRFADRIRAHLALAAKNNADKRLVLMIFNSPCRGVEATVGVGYELDIWNSVWHIMNRLKAEGYSVAPFPESGEELKNLFMEKKAYSDFRWTNVEHICKAGGVLYKMPPDEYAKFYGALPAKNRLKLEELYGPPPGEGMVVDGDIVISGLPFGNVLLMLQPKRGCYGPKCTGEVCKILQDPLCPPTHQYLATYYFLNEVWKADACVHIGTEGSLEFLPGKANGLSAGCWPDIALGKLPNFYLYHSGVPGEAVAAKRRSYAVTVDYLPASKRSVTPRRAELVRLINAYEEAVQMKSEQAEPLAENIDRLLSQEPELERFVSRQEPENAFKLLRQAITAASESEGKWHTFGVGPDAGEKSAYIKEIWDGETHMEPELARFGPPGFERDGAIEKFIENALSGLCAAEDPLAADARELGGLLDAAELEMESLMRALSGGYVQPGIYGSPSDNGREALPTGRNIYTLDAAKIPTPVSYKAGADMADLLLKKYLEEEGKYPERIALNMMSVDITKTKGVMLSQFLNLLGIAPVWDGGGKVVGLKLIPPEELKRPRIDATVRITGVMRDAWPTIVELMDDAALLAAAADEPDESNYIRKHNRGLIEDMKLADINEDARKAAVRIFGDAPGSYGAGIDLALKASAWNDERDLAKYFIEASAHAYGRGLRGEKSVREFVYHAGRTDISYDNTISKRFDALSEGFSAEVQGGFGLVAKVAGGKAPKRYRGLAGKAGKNRVAALGDELEESMVNTLFNPIWKQDMLDKGYQGCGEIMHRLQNVFSWQCLTESIDSRRLDEAVREYILDEDTRRRLAQDNPFALEETARRFLELYERKKWDADEECLNKLREVYLAVEGDMEDGVGDGGGEVQAGSIEIFTDKNDAAWGGRLSEINRVLEGLGKL